jgi:pimeloyl-ACP methyl ester carboxylesterase
MRRRGLRRLAGWLLLCAGLLAPVVYTQEASPQLADKYFRAAGATIRYVESGEGDVLVLIHGFGANADVPWVRGGILAKLAADFRVVALDCRGHGKSDRPHDPAEYGRKMAADVAALLDHLNVRRAHVAGYSMGGLIASTFAAVHGDRALSVTIGGSGGRRPGVEQDLRDDDALAASLEQGTGIRPLLVRMSPPGEPLPPDRSMALASAIFLQRNDPLALAAVVRGWRDLALTDAELKAVSVPLQAIVGTADPNLPRVLALKALLPDLKLVTIEGATHGGSARATTARPEFVAAIREFGLAQRATVPSRRR